MPQAKKGLCHNTECDFICVYMLYVYLHKVRENIDYIYITNVR